MLTGFRRSIEFSSGFLHFAGVYCVSSGDDGLA